MSINIEQQITDSIKQLLQSDYYVQRDLSDEEIKEIIKEKLSEALRDNDLRLSVSEKKVLLDTIFNSIKRLDILQPLIDSKEISEVMIYSLKKMVESKDII